MDHLLAALIGYLLGSLPIGLLAVRLLKRLDVRKYGSGNIGTTNVLRVAGPRVAILVLMMDMGKGALAVFIASRFSDASIAQVMGGLAAIVGHNWSLFLRFRGGRGIATAEGALFVLAPLAGVVALAAFLLTVLGTRYVSLGSLSAVATGAIIIIVGSALDILPRAYLIFAAVAVPILVLRHWQNIQRLRNGTEPRLGQRTDPHSSPPASR